MLLLMKYLCEIYIVFMNNYCLFLNTHCVIEPGWIIMNNVVNIVGVIIVIFWFVDISMSARLFIDEIMNGKPCKKFCVRFNLIRSVSYICWIEMVRSIIFILSKFIIFSIPVLHIHIFHNDIFGRRSCWYHR